MKYKLIMIALVASGLLFWVYHKNHKAEKATSLPSVWVQTITVKPQLVPLAVNAIGTLTAKSIKITPEIAGPIKKIRFQDGRFVKAGEVLFELSDAIYRAKNQSAQARLRLSENNFHRAKLLGKKKVFAQQTVDQAEADFKEKKAASFEAEAQLAQLKLQAPFAGIVGRSKVSPGDFVSIGQELTTLTDTTHLRIEYHVPESYLPQLKLGQTVKVTTSAYPKQLFEGKVAYISPTINPNSRSVFLYADLLNEKNLLVPGMFVNVQQSLGNKQEVLLIPARSLVPILDGKQVFKVIDGKAFATPVLISERLQNDVQVVQGLAAGDVVITDGQLKVKSGFPVKIKT